MQPQTSRHVSLRGIQVCYMLQAQLSQSKVSQSDLKILLL